VIMSTLPAWRFIETDAGTNLGVWDIEVRNGVFNIRRRLDDLSVGEVGITLTGNSSAEITLVALAGDEIDLTAPTLDFNGNADISGTLAVGGAATFSNNVTVSGTISGNGSGLTNLNADNLSSGTVPDARLSNNVPLLNAANVFSATQTISASSAAVLNLFGSSSNMRVSFYNLGAPENQGRYTWVVQN